MTKKIRGFVWGQIIIGVCCIFLVFIELSFFDFIYGNSAVVDVFFENETAFKDFVEWANKENVSVVEVEKRDADYSVYILSKQLRAKISLREGKYPKDNQFICDVKTGDDKQSGLIKRLSPFHSIRIYDLNKADRIGFTSRYYISLYNNEEVNLMIEELRNKGIIVDFVTFINGKKMLMSSPWLNRQRVIVIAEVCITVLLMDFWLVVSRLLEHGNDEKIINCLWIPMKIIIAALSIFSVSCLYFLMQDAWTEGINLKMCSDKTDIYRVVMNYVGQDVSLEKEIEIQGVTEKAYSILCQENCGFLMDADSINMYDAIKSNSAFNGLYDENGLETHITVSPNYLLVNPIYTTDGEMAYSRLDYDENTLNLLVPEKYMSIKMQLTEQFIQYLIFNRFTIHDRIYKSASNDCWEPIKSQPKVNIIPIKDGQAFYTYKDTIRRQDRNCIIDPVTVVYTSNFHPNYILGMASRVLYFRYNSSNCREADEYLLSLTGVKGFLCSESTYQEMKSNFVEKIIDVVFSLIWLILCVWSYLRIGMGGYKRKKRGDHKSYGIQVGLAIAGILLCVKVSETRFLQMLRVDMVKGIVLLIVLEILLMILNQRIYKSTKEIEGNTYATYKGEIYR
jgi:hypothetical protein